jgi:hypothetical protein
MKKIRARLHQVACWVIPGYHYVWECQFLYRDINRLGREIRKLAMSAVDELNTFDRSTYESNFEKKSEALYECIKINGITYDLQRQAIYAFWHTAFSSNRRRLREIHAELDQMLQEKTMEKLAQGLE